MIAYLASAQADRITLIQASFARESRWPRKPEVLEAEILLRIFTAVAVLGCPSAFTRGERAGPNSQRAGAPERLENKQESM